MNWYQNKIGKDPHEAVFKTVRNIKERQSGKTEKDLRHYRLFGNMLNTSDPISVMRGELLTFNLVRSICSTLTSKICKNKPRPMYLTDDGDYPLQQKAERMSRFTLGMFHQAKTYTFTKEALLNSTIFGTGLIKVFSQDGVLKNRSVLPLDIVVDEREGMYNAPKTIYETRLVDRGVLKEMYPEHAKKIEEAAKEKSEFVSDNFDTDLVLVVEGYKLGVKDTPGKHFLGIENCTFVYEDYKRDKFPYAKLVFERNPIGWFGVGAAELVTPHQIELNRTLKRISHALHMLASPKVLYDLSSKINKAHFNNDVGIMIGYAGGTNPPQFIMPQAIGPELPNHAQMVIAQAYSEVGISALTATSMKPAGLNSGKALREYNDIETERFADFGQNWEQFHLDIGELMIEEVQELEEKGTPLKVTASDGKRMERVSFKDVKLPRDSYVYQAYPTSLLPKSPAGQLEYAGELIDRQMLSPEEGLKLLDFPDVKSITTLKYSGLDDIMATISSFLDEGYYIPPEPYQDLVNGVKWMQSAYLKYKHKKIAPERLDMLLQWINDASSMLAGQQANEPMATAEDASVPMEEEMGDPAMMENPEMMPEEGMEGIDPNQIPA